MSIFDIKVIESGYLPLKLNFTLAEIDGKDASVVEVVTRIK